MKYLAGFFALCWIAVFIAFVLGATIPPVVVGGAFLQSSLSFVRIVSDE